MEDLKVTKIIISKKISIISVTAELPKPFRKEIEINTEDYDIEHVRAVFSVGNLSLQLPKKVDPNVVEISRQKFEKRKFLQKSVQGMQNIISSAVEYSYSEKKIAVGVILVGSGFFVYKYYTKCYGVKN